MVRNLGRAQPVTPEADRGRQRTERLVLVSRNVVTAPGQRDEGRLALGERRTAVTASAHHAERDGARHLQVDITLRRGNNHRVVAVPLITPRATGRPVIELRATVHDGLDPAADACRDPHQRAHGAEISRSPVVVRPPSLVLDRADGQEILDNHPSRRRLPGCFQHHRPRHVSAVLRNVDIGGTEPEHASGSVQQRPEHTRGIGSGQAQPFDRPVRRDQAALLAIRQEPIISNRRERTHWYLTSRGRDRNVRRFGLLSISACASVPPLAPPPMTMRSQRSVT